MGILDGIRIIPRPDLGTDRVLIVAALMRHPGETDADFEVRTLAASALLVNVSAPYRVQH